MTSEILSFGFGLKIGKSSGKISGLLVPQFPIGSAFTKYFSQLISFGMILRLHCLIMRQKLLASVIQSVD